MSSSLPGPHVPASTLKSHRRLAVLSDGRHRAPSRDGRPLRIGELAKRTGKTVRALHLYEEIGLLEPESRTDAGYRLYAPDSVIRVEWITRLQQTGLSLPEIRNLLASWGSSPSAPDAMQKVTEFFRRKLDETRAQIARLRELEDELVRSLEYLETCRTCEPVRVVSSCPSCDRHQPDEQPPVLVAGFHSSVAPSSPSETRPPSTGTGKGSPWP